MSAAQITTGSDNPFYPQKLATTRFYIQNVLPRSRVYGDMILASGPALQDYPEGWL